MNFRVASLVYKTLATGQPGYLLNFLNTYQPVRSLRSQDKPTTSKTLSLHINRSSRFQLKPHSHCARARMWTHAEPRARTYDTHVRGYDHARAWSYLRVRRRLWTHVAAVARNNANYAETAWYCAILRAVAAKITQHHAQIEPSSICA